MIKLDIPSAPPRLLITKKDFQISTFLVIQTLLPHRSVSNATFSIYLGQLYSEVVIATIIVVYLSHIISR